eukprot:UN31391
MCEEPNTNMMGVVGSCDIQSPLFTNQMEHFHRNFYFKGVRDVLHMKEHIGFIKSPQVLSNLEYLGKEGKFFQVCARPETLDTVLEVVDYCLTHQKFQNVTKFVIDHCGGIQGLD